MSGGGGGRDQIPDHVEEADEYPKFEDSINYLAALKATLTPEGYGSLLRVIDDFRKGRCDFEGVKARAKELLRENRYLTRGFNVFVRKAERLEVPPPSKDVAVDLATARRFLYKIKCCLTGSNQILDSFLHIIQNLGEEGKSSIEIYREVAFLLRHDQNLLDEFTQFLPDNLKPTASVASSPDWKDLVQLMSSAVKETKELPECMWSTELLTFCNKVKEQLDAQDYQKFLDHLKSHSNNGLSSDELQDLVGDLLVDHPALFREFKDSVRSLKKRRKPYLKRGKNGKFLPKCASSDDKQAEGSAGETELAIEDIDFSHCFSLTPSYWLLPEMYQNPEMQKRKRVEEQVLNNCCVSVASGSEDCGGALRSSNPYEEKLFDCEDELYEMDTLLDNGSSVISRMRLLLEKITDPRIKIKIPIRLDDHFKAMNIRCIAQVYGEESCQVLEALKENPRRELPVVLERMNQQRQQWVKQREEYSKVSAEVMRKNNHKSLAHRVFFKKQDGKKMSAKAPKSEREEVEKKVAVPVGEADKLDKPVSMIRKKRSSRRGGAAASSGSKSIEGSEIEIGAKNGGKSIKGSEVEMGVKNGSTSTKGSEVGIGVKNGGKSVKGSEVEMGVKNGGKSIKRSEVEMGVKNGGISTKWSETKIGVKNGGISIEGSEVEIGVKNGGKSIKGSEVEMGVKNGGKWIKGSEVEMGVKNGGKSTEGSEIEIGVKKGGKSIEGSEVEIGVKDGVSRKTEKISFFLGTRDLLRPKRQKK